MPGLRLAASALAVAALLSAPARADDTVVHHATAWSQKSFPKKAAMQLGGEYARFLGKHKTEREVVSAALGLGSKAGFVDLLGKHRGKAAPGSKLYAVVHGKLAAFVVVGKRPLADGLHVVASHVDAVRIDLKQNPVYAGADLALLETHYYGGIKKYQWLSTPLELRGVVVKKGGQKVDVAIGDDPDEPVLVIPDEAAPLSSLVDDEEGEQVPGEKLDPIVSSTPGDPGAKDPFAAEAARLLQAEYGFSLADLAAAELELVPATAARDVGIDRALVGGYGQDDRACAYAALRAILATAAPDHTAIVVLADKEEIGSTGNTGAQSSFMRRLVAELADAAGDSASESAIDGVLASSIVFSADVTGGLNPHYVKAYQPRSAPYVGAGVVWNQTAVHAELMAYVRDLFDAAGVVYQTAEWRKSDASKTESGTVLPYFTQQGMNGLVVAIPLLSMHSPFELVSKADLYEGFLAYKAFLAD